ncbi:MAG: hypothetical protein JSV21_06320 [Nitrospirota bacterium]|nr:MAG: hypothetical protein JSV21_06320 [Nitrospirota bacterium]
MKYNRCVCLNCSQTTAMFVSRQEELDNVDCPSCGTKRLVILQPNAAAFGGG